MTTLTKNTDLLKQEVHEHIEADAVVQGSYWSDGKGCFIGCLTHCDDTAPAVERFGLTEPILRIAECIFESLPPEEARQFFCDFPDAIQCDGKDLSLVHWAFLGETLRNLPPQESAIQAVIDPVINGMELLASGGIWEEAAAEAAEATARGAPWAVRAAARVAARGAAWSAAEAETHRQRDSLLRLIRQAPVVTPS